MSSGSSTSSTSKWLLSLGLAAPLCWLAYRQYQRSASKTAAAAAATDAAAAAPVDFAPYRVSTMAEALAVRQWLGATPQCHDGTSYYPWHLLTNVLNGSLSLSDAQVRVWVDSRSAPKCCVTLYRSLYVYATDSAALARMLRSGVIPRPALSLPTAPGEVAERKQWVGCAAKTLVDTYKTTPWRFAPATAEADGDVEEWMAEAFYDHPFDQYRIDAKADFKPLPASPTTTGSSGSGGIGGEWVVTHPKSGRRYRACVERLVGAEDAKVVDDNWKYRNATTLVYVNTLLATFPAYGVRLYPLPATGGAATAAAEKEEEAPQLVSWNIATDYGGSGLQFTMEEWRGLGIANRLVEAHVTSHHLFTCNRSHRITTTSSNTGISSGSGGSSAADDFAREIIPYPMSQVVPPAAATTAEGSKAIATQRATTVPDCNALSAAAHAELVRVARPHCYIAPDNAASIRNSGKCGYRPRDTVHWLGFTLKPKQKANAPAASAAAAAAAVNPAQQC